MINAVKKIVKPKPYETEEIISITCDACKRVYTMDDTYEIQEFHHIRKGCGYGSVFGDGDFIRVAICQHCLKKIIEENCGDVKNFTMEGDY